jgi:CheY-like chemotaxis protein
MNGKAMSTILVVDDQPQIQQMYRAVLRRGGYDVVVASNGLEALRAMETRFPDLILLDMAMPEMDGVAFLQIIRQTPEWARIPVILITAFATETKVEMAHVLGVVDHFVKADFSVKELRRRIEFHLAQPRAKVA